MARPGEDCRVLTDDGAGCWMQDPRAVYIEGEHRRTFAGWMTHDGKLIVGQFDHDTGETREVVLKPRWDRDDHNNNSFLVLSDRRLMAFYSRHNGRGLFSRTTTAPEDIGVWDDEVVVTSARRITYTHPVYLSDEKRFYVFFRGPSWKPTVASSADARVWSAPQILIEERGREAFNIRPYLKVASDGKSAIHFAFTDGHPRDETRNSIYYLRYERGEFTTAGGSKVGKRSDLPMRPSASERVYDARSSGVRAWHWDIAVDANGFPVIVYARLPKTRDHRYHYARFDGRRWVDHEITAAGRWFPQTPRGSIEREPHYSGGMALDHANPDVVYLSRQVRDVFEIEKWTTRDLGRTWTSEAVTANSRASNIRPVVPRGYAGNANHVLWMHGKYIHYTDYWTDIRMVTPADTPVPGPR